VGDDVNGREVPWDESTEAAAIGYLLGGWPTVDRLRVVDALSADDFWLPQHRSVYEHMAAMFGEGKLVEPLTVAARIGGDVRPMLDALAAGAGIHGGAYAEVLARLGSLRRGIALGENLVELGYDGDLDGLLSSVDAAEGELRPALAHVESFNAADLVALADLDDATPQKPWVLPGLLRVNEKLIVTGGEGVGKSTFSRQMAVTVASGIHPLLCIPVGDEPLSTLVIDLQEDDVDSALAMRPMIRRAGDALDPNMLHAVQWPAGINLLTRRDFVRVESLIAQHRPSLVVMGPLVRLFRSEGDRSRYSEDLVDELTDHLDELMVRYGFALILEGHAGNERSTEEAWRPRGSSVWRSWPSVGIGLEGISSMPREAKVHQWRWSRYADRAWPSRLVGGPGWPWTLDSADYETLARKLGLDWLIDGAQKEMVF
jgi:replicative DNA helicase